MPTTVADLMTHPPLIVRSDANVRDAVALLLSKNAPQLDMVDERGRFVGSVPDYELLKTQLSGDDDLVVSRLMSKASPRIDAEMTAEFAAKLFCDGRYRRLPVICEGLVVGQLDRRDVMRLLHAGTNDDPSAEDDFTVTQQLPTTPVRDLQLRQRRNLNAAGRGA